MEKFRLTVDFLDPYKDRQPPFGFGGLGALVYERTYSRIKDDDVNEQWWETIRRAVEGCYNMQKRHIELNGLGWNPQKAQHSAQEMYARMWGMKFLPPGRGLWAMGSAITEERECFAALNNCGFVSTKGIAQDFAKPFLFDMDASMLGVGIGFDTSGAGLVTIRQPKTTGEPMVIPDSREGWVDSVGRLLMAYRGGPMPVFDYSLIRSAGQPIKGFGGTASGPEPLMRLHEDLRVLLDAYISKVVSKRLIVDIMNMIGKCVVAGNVRRSAGISLDTGIDLEYLQLKDYQVNPDREAHGWSSNNSVNLPVGSDYHLPANLTQKNGEPGYVWLDNAKAYSRMDSNPDHKDDKAEGINPCGEQTLESFELCCLVETFPHRCDDLADYLRTLKFAYLYAKTVTLGKTTWPETNRILLRNRRIGCSMSGIVQFIAARGIHELRKWCIEGYKTVGHYDEIYSNWLCIPKSIKTTSVKPSGTVSLLAGATPGVHYPESLWYLRRVRLAKDSPLIPPLVKAGYKVEPCVGQEESTVVVEIPVQLSENIRTLKQVTMWEQLELAAFMQRYWADNQVSVTVTFNPETEGASIEHALSFYQYRLKGVSFLPRTPQGAFAQMPYEEITQDEYNTLAAGLKPLNFRKVKNAEAVIERFCDSESCTLEE